MAETLYRKYRPTRFADVAEQTHILRTIQNQLAHGTLAHAYLFSGPRGVGKTTIARLLAKAANCTGRTTTSSSPSETTSEPCNACDACISFAEGRYMDTIEMDAASNTGVENVRDNIIENVRFVPQVGKYKIFIIDEVHMLSPNAFNALLKTLEEPPSHALFILATTELHKIPATIISRCQRFDFHRIPVAEMTVRLRMIAEREGVIVDAAVLHQIARLSEGCLRDAESLLGQVLAVATLSAADATLSGADGGSTIGAADVASVLPSTNITLCVSLVDALSCDDISLALRLLNELVTDGGAVRYLQDELVEYLRTVLLAALGSVEKGTYDARTDEAIVASASKLGAHEARRLLDLVLTARTRPTLTLLPQLPLEIAFVEFLDRDTSPSPLQPPQSQPPPTPHRQGGEPLVAPRVPAESYGHGVAVPTNPDPAARLSFSAADLQNKWERCCSYVADRNIALPLVLRDARPISVEGNTVTLAFAYGFHADAMKDQKNIRLVEDAIAAVMMERPIIKTVVQAVKNDDAATTLAVAFGGTIV